MLNNISICFSFNTPPFLQYSNYIATKQLFLFFNKYDRVVYSKVESGINKNNGILLKESPFHYPIAKKVLSKKKNIFSIERSFFFNGKKHFYLYDIKKTFSIFFNINRTGLSSLFYLRNTKCSFVVLYRPRCL